MIIVIDLGHREIRAAVMDGNKVVKCFRAGTAGISGSSLGDMESSANEIKEALVKNNVTARKCRIVIPSSAAVIREMLVPRVVEKDIQGYVRTQFSGMMQINDKDVIQFLITAEDDEFITVLGFVIPSFLVEQCVKLAALAGMKCQRVELRMNALRKYLSRQDISSEEAYMVAMLENGRAEINLIEKSKLFVRTVELSKSAGNDSDNLLKNWAMSFNDALVTAPEQSDWTESFGQQIDTIINFQLTRNREMPVRKVYICGEVDERLQTDVSRRIQLPVEFLKEESKLPYIYAVGAGLETDPEHDFDLVAAIRKKSPQEIRIVRRYTIFGCLMAVIFAAQIVLGMVIGFGNDLTENEIDTIQAYLTDPEINEKADMAMDVEKVLKEQQLYNQILMLFNQEFDQAFRFQSSYVEGVYQQGQFQDISFEYISFQEGKLSIVGYAPDSFRAAEFASALESSRVAAEVSFQGYEKNYQNPGSKYKFQVTGVIQ